MPGAEINVSIFIEFVQGLASADLSDVFSCRNGCQSNGRISEKGL
ncbi:hypothetical protein V8V75_12760 [Peribacillus frigoritolerans]